MNLNFVIKVVFSGFFIWFSLGLVFVVVEKVVFGD